MRALHISRMFSTCRPMPPPAAIALTVPRPTPPSRCGGQPKSLQMRRPQRWQGADRCQSPCPRALHSAPAFPGLSRPHPLNLRSCFPPVFIRDKFIAGENCKSGGNLKMQNNLPMPCDKLTKLEGWSSPAKTKQGKTQHGWPGLQLGRRSPFWSAWYQLALSMARK
jgi:hypothetical protein